MSVKTILLQIEAVKNADMTTSDKIKLIVVLRKKLKEIT